MHMSSLVEPIRLKLSQCVRQNEEYVFSIISGAKSEKDPPGQVLIQSPACEGSVEYSIDIPGSFYECSRDNAFRAK
jgi:hypothetical protein